MPADAHERPTSSCGGGASMTTAVPPGPSAGNICGTRRRPPAAARPASPQPARRTKSARSLSLSETPKRSSPCSSARRPSPSMESVTVSRSRGRSAAQPLRPFDERNTIGARLFPPQFEDLLGRLQAVKIEMPEDAGRRLVDLDQREGRAGHDQCRDRPRRRAGWRARASFFRRRGRPAGRRHRAAAGAWRGRPPAAPWRPRQAGKRRKSAPVLRCRLFNTLPRSTRCSVRASCGSISSGRGRP